ncbi:MAG TPA: hypothetical protein VF503_00085 [Sphingobium sp.]|uniref:hypothetical protein n=1 Tax=Sphingobium sp. TaxID=1912891 RepID=UPI002ED3249E
MARIRSIHPGFFTDEELVCVSMAARLLFLGLGVEADDKGVFEWKPLTIKMKIFPADNLDVDTVLAELEHANAIRKYEIDGRRYGAIRNFRKFQRPKTPNDIHPSTAEIRNYVGLPDPISEPFPPKGEKSPQMEDGGDKMEDGGEKKKEGGGRAKRAPAEPYAFEGSIIRLNREHFENWRKTYHGIPDLRAELTAIDGWLARQSENDRKDWFHRTPGMLNRKHQEAVTANRTASRNGGELELPIA